MSKVFESKCPHCGEHLKISNGKYGYIRQYLGNSIVRADCCGNLVHVMPHVSFNIAAYSGNRTKDDWSE